MKIVFLPHCILDQTIHGNKGCVKELLELFAESQIGIFQMPCPELEFNNGLKRNRFSKEELEKNGYRKLCNKISKDILNKIELYKQNNHDVLGIIGIEFSPTYGVHMISNGKRNIPGKGIFIEEIEKEMEKRNFQVPILGLNLNNTFSTIEKLHTYLKFAGE